MSKRMRRPTTARTWRAQAQAQAQGRGGLPTSGTVFAQSGQPSRDAGPAFSGATEFSLLAVANSSNRRLLVCSSHVRTNVLIIVLVYDVLVSCTTTMAMARPALCARHAARTGCGTLVILGVAACCCHCCCCGVYYVARRAREQVPCTLSSYSHIAPASYCYVLHPRAEYYVRYVAFRLSGLNRSGRGGVPNNSTT